MRQTLLTAAILLASAAIASAADGNRLTYLNETHPYVPHTNFPKLTTPQWVGDQGVEAVVVLAIDDMRDPPKYEAYLRPILQRLKQIDGRAPVSIMTCKVKPDELQLQSWIDEGLSIEVHTRDHPCPILKDGDFAKAKATYDACVDQMSSIPRNTPVAFRTPCCDSLNTVSPRFFSEIFNKTTPEGRFLQIDSSVFNVFTDDDPDIPRDLLVDPDIPRDLLVDPDGKPKFEKYVPYDRSFVNTIENYPYPYVIHDLCWEFDCVAPSDWSAQHYHNNVYDERTVRDLKAAIDITVLKKGVLNLVFHPHGWIRNDQVVELIDHAVQKHGGKVKFLTFREALQRLNENLLAGRPLRNKDGSSNGTRILDVDNDGFMDVVTITPGKLITRNWNPDANKWNETTTNLDRSSNSAQPQFAVTSENGQASIYLFDKRHPVGLTWSSNGWTPAPESTALIRDVLSANNNEPPRTLQFRDLNNDGRCELLVADTNQHSIWTPADNATQWRRLKFTLPDKLSWRTPNGKDAGLRFVDINGDNHDDVLFSDANRYGLWLWKDMKSGWSIQATAGARGEKDPQDEIPPVVRADGTDNGVWFHSRHMWIQNEDTAELPNLVDRRSYEQLLSGLPAQPTLPAAALKTLHVKDGFRIEQVAAEPLVTDPVAIDWGPDGRLWVAEMSDYPNGPPAGGPPLGRVKFLTDDNNDGKYDRATIFLDKIPYPNGVLAWKGGVLITAAPEIIFAEDLNGDGRADRKDVLYSGFIPGNPQHRVNGFARGLDNWLYIANGDSGGDVLSTRTGDKVNFRGHDLRIHPADGRLELTTGRTQFGRHRDDWGNWFGCNNSHPIFQYVLEDRYLRRNPHFAPPAARIEIRNPPGNAPVFPRSFTLERFNDWHTAGKFTSACSTNVYRDTLFGPDYYGNIFTCEPVHNLVSRSVLTPDGVTFVAQRAADEQETEFLASTDNWFRPTQVKTGPDGALWVVDMYRYVIEHPQWIPQDWQDRLDLRAGADRGRIYRIVPAHKNPRPIPQLAESSTADLVKSLGSTNGWERDLAQELLVQRRDEGSIPLLKHKAADDANPLGRLHALCTLDGLNALDADLLTKSLADPHPGVRRHAVRLSEPFLDKHAKLIQQILRMADDNDPHVQMQVAYAIGQCKCNSGGTALARIAFANAGDPYRVAAVMSSLRADNIGSMVNQLVNHPEPQHAALRNAILNQAVALGTDKVFTHLLAAGLAESAAADRTSQMRTVAAILAAAQRKRKDVDVLIDAQPGLTESLSQLFEHARQLLNQPDEPPDTLLAAVDLLPHDTQHRDVNITLCGGLLTPRHSAELQSRVIESLGTVPDDAVATLLISRWNQSLPAVKSSILDTLLQRTSWTRKFLEAVRDGNVPAAEIDASRRQRLLASRDGAVRKLAADVLATVLDPNRTAVVERYAAETPKTGEAVRGREIFTKRCSVCHRLQEKGFNIGPDLASLKDRSRVAMLTAIFDPNRAVETKFIAYVAVTKAGITHTGMLAEETGNSITLVAQEGKKTTLLRSDIEELAGTRKSLMPEGLEKDLTPADVADVLAYLDSVARPPKTFDGNAPRVVTAGDDGVIVLPATAAEIYGPSLVFESQFQNLGYWQSPQDYAAWTVDVPRAGQYEVRLLDACANDTAGNVLLITAGDEKLAWRVSGTGNWNTYQKPTIGRLPLPPGRHRIVVSATPELKGALIDLREIRLTPVE